MAPKKRKVSESRGEDWASKKTRSSAASPGSVRRTTRSMTLDAARQAVLATTELLEAIIVCLPPKDIFVIQRVSRRFRDCIGCSTQIQQKLFIKTCAEKEAWVLRTLQPMVDPRLSHQKEYEFVPAAPGLTNVVPSRKVLSATICSILRSRVRPALANGKWHWKEERFHFDMASLVNLPGSWQAVKVTDPPCATAKLSTDFRFEEASTTFFSKGFIDVYCASGITLGDVYNAIMHTTQTLHFVERGPGAPKPIVGTRCLTMERLFSDLTRNVGGRAATLHHLTINMMTPEIIIPTDLERERARQRARKM